MLPYSHTSRIRPNQSVLSPSIILITPQQRFYQCSFYILLNTITKFEIIDIFSISVDYVNELPRTIS
jgi:hypothetical protein